MITQHMTNIEVAFEVEVSIGCSAKFVGKICSLGYARETKDYSLSAESRNEECCTCLWGTSPEYLQLVKEHSQ